MPTLSELFNLDPKVERLALMPRMRGSLGSDYGVSPEMQNSVMFEGKKGFMPDVIAPKVLYDFIRAIKAPGRAARGEVLDEEEALNTALNMFGGGLATSGGVPAGSLGMFIGPKSPAFNKEALKTALELEKAGVKPEEIWKQTMTARGLDRQFRQEISDKEALLDMSKVPQRPDRLQVANQWLEEKGFIPQEKVGILGVGSSENLIPRAAQDEALQYADTYLKSMAVPTTRLTRAMTHPELEEAYPNLVNNLQLGRETSTLGVRGRYDPGKKLITTGGSEMLSKSPSDDARSTLLHEIQHAIQETENFGRGGSPGMAKEIAAAQFKADIAPYAAKKSLNEYYWNQFGAAARSEYMMRLSDIANKENIRPRTIYNLQDWYKYGNDYRNMAGVQPKKPGPARDAWFQGAADYIRQQNLMTDPRYRSMPYQTISEAKNAQRRAMTQIKKTDEARQKYQTIRAKEKNIKGMTDEEVYRRLAGEAEARLTQTRQNLTMDERRANYPFAQQYDESTRKVNPYGLDIPPQEAVAYTDLTQPFDPMMQFLGSNAPVDDPLMRFLFAPQGK